MGPSLSATRFILGSVATSAGLFGAVVLYRIYPSTRQKVATTVQDIPLSFRNSKALRNIVNPRDHPYEVCDTRSTVITIPTLYRDITDEVLLAHFVRGFFGGYVLAPEKIILNQIRLRETAQFSSRYPIRLCDTNGRTNKLAAILGNVKPEQLWQSVDLPEDRLPSLHSETYSAFQVIDIQLDNRFLKEHSGESHIDFGFGSDTTKFAGCHRFRVTRNPGDENVATISFDSAVGNPLTRTRTLPWGLGVFHLVYSDLLFREGVSEILRAMSSD